MKLHTLLLERFIDAPKDQGELHALLDDLGLEVKGIETHPSHTLFTIETLANRGDHLCALGVAREIAARTFSQIRYPKVGDLPERRSSVVVRKNTPLCPRYALLEMALPKGMGLREDVAVVVGGEDGKKHPIVDILNYVWMEFGQPMHAFDKDKVEGDIAVEVTTQVEEIEGLDGKSYRVPPDAIVIRDKRRIIAVAGVIGCANTMVTPDTTRVVVESATFDPVAVRKTARSMGISTDASYTFERGSDIDSVLTALKRVVYLVEGGGTSANLGQAVGLTYVEGSPTERRRVPLRFAAVRAHMNLPRLSEVEICTRLKHLGFQIDPISEGSKLKEVQVGVPSWRLWDIQNEADLVEEFARVHGLNNVKLALPPLDYEIAPPNDLENLRARVEPSLLGAGFNEVITRAYYSGEDVKALTALDGSFADSHVLLKNSLESAYSHVKATNVVHLAKLAAWNVRMGVPSVKMFEFGRVFSRSHRGAQYEFEREMLTMACAGRWVEHEWRKPEALDEVFFLFKGVVESVLSGAGRTLIVGEGTHAFLHPGYQGAILSGREVIGHFGVVHPLLKDAFDLRTDVLYAEIEGESLFKEREGKSRSLPSDYPSIRRDITLRVPPAMQAGKTCAVVRGLKLDTLTDVSVADEFSKEGEDFRRVTYRLTFQSMERTLEHPEIDACMTQVLGVLRDKLKLDLAG